MKTGLDNIEEAVEETLCPNCKWDSSYGDINDLLGTLDETKDHKGDWEEWTETWKCPKCKIYCWKLGWDTSKK